MYFFFIFNILNSSVRIFFLFNIENLIFLVREKEGRLLATSIPMVRNQFLIYLSVKQALLSTMVARTAREVLRWLEGLYLTYPIVVPKWYVD